MEPAAWLARWREGRIGFHLDAVNPHLVRHVEALPAPGSRLFVPLCGKSVDMRWLWERGHRVVGVELSDLAVRAFFEEQKVAPEIDRVAAFERFRHGGIEVLCGDFFALDAAVLGRVDGVWDRAALIALPPPMRARYVAHLVRLLPAEVRILLVTCEYVETEMEPPPHSVREAEVRALYGPHFDVTVRERHDTLSENPNFRQRGLTGLDEVVFELVRKPAPSA